MSLLERFGRAFRPSRRRQTNPWSEDSAVPRIVHVSHHKVGTVWFSDALRSVAKEYGFKFVQGGDTSLTAADIAPAGVVLFEHARGFDPDLFAGRAYSGSHMIRDPRDVVVSGYFYHLWTEESWARVPSEEFGGVSYQQHLNSLSQDDGLLVEIRRTTEDAVGEMGRWNYDRPEFIELRYEDVIGNEREAFRRVFLHHGFTADAAERAAELCDRFSFTKVTKRPVGTVEEHSHRRSGSSGQWRELFQAEHRELFEQLNPGLVERLGYGWD